MYRAHGRPVTQDQDKCTWCGNPVEATEGFRLTAPTGDRGAVFCRLEHVVPWAIQGARWDGGQQPQPRAIDRPAICAGCGAPLPDSHVLLVRHRGEHRIPDGFCSVGHLADWAKAGGRWQRRP